MFSKFKIGTRLYILVALAAAVMISTLTFGLFHSQKGIVLERKAALEMLDDTVLAVLARYHAQE